MKLREVRKIIRQSLLERTPSRDFDYVPIQPSTFKKGEWELLVPGDSRRSAIQNVIFDMVSDTYADIGGHVKIKAPGDLERYHYWIVNDLDDDDDPDVIMMGKPEFGAKMGGAATDGSGAAATAYKDKGAELRAGGTVGGVGNWWGEVSGKPAYALLSRGAPSIESEEAVAALLAGDDYEWHGAHPDPNAPRLFKTYHGWYTKRFGDAAHTKIIIGNPTVGDSGAVEEITAEAVNNLELRFYIRNLINEVFQSHAHEPALGDEVENVNPGCEHYGSKGVVIDVSDLVDDAGKTITYKVTNNGNTYNRGMNLTKTMDQLAPRRKSP